MSRRLGVILGLRATIIGALVLIAVRSALGTGFELRALLAFLPALLALAPVLFAVERRPDLRPIAGLFWVVVFDLAAMGVLLATLGEATEPELLAFLLLALVVATARDLVPGALAGAMAAIVFVVLAIRHGLASGPLDPLLLARATLFLAAGAFTGYLSREAEEERHERAVQTAELRQELSDLGLHLQNVLSCVASGVIVLDAAGRVTTWNPAAERILGIPAAAALGRAPGRDPDLAGLLPLIAEPLVHGGPPGHEPRHDLPFERPDGRRVRIGYARSPLLDAAGGRQGLIVVLQDVTLIEDYRARMQQQEKLAALGGLVSGIAHEFGNLLGGARGLVDLALLGDPAEARETLPVVRDTLGRALETVEHLLRFARATPLQLAPGVAPGAGVERALLLARPILEPREVALERALADVPPVVADAGQLEQVVLNLVTNAAHALEARPPAERRLRVGLTAGEGEVRITVEDSGPGISPELRGRIFEPFFTTKGALGGSATPGSGLGLSIALGIVEGHRGRLSVGESPDLGGARFEVALPLC